MIHRVSGRSATFGELAADAALLDPPVHPQLKSFGQYSIVGKPTPRFDIPSKVDGTAIYGIDVKLPGMLYATVGGGAGVWGTSSARSILRRCGAMPGVEQGYAGSITQSRSSPIATGGR